MGDGGSLINLGNLSKPATVLIKKIAGAFGILYEPRRIRREAEAQADAERIRAKASIEIAELRERAVNRVLHQELRKQRNIEQITAQAADSLAENAKPEDLDEDWIAYFFKHCETVSDSDDLPGFLGPRIPRKRLLVESLISGSEKTPWA